MVNGLKSCVFDIWTIFEFSLDFFILHEISIILHSHKFLWVPWYYCQFYQWVNFTAISPNSHFSSFSFLIHYFITEFVYSNHSTQFTTTFNANNNIVYIFCDSHTFLIGALPLRYQFIFPPQYSSFVFPNILKIILKTYTTSQNTRNTSVFSLFSPFIRQKLFQSA